MPSVYDRFNLVSDFELAGDQPRAIAELVDGLERGDRHQVLLGVTGSGKTFTMAQAIARVNRPTLVMVHNKTLAAQLFQEFRRFFPDNAVEYFVSYYDYYQPEAYVPATDSYIEKEATINDEIDRMRLSATRSLFERRDVIIVASVSCIYGLGSPEAYYGMLLPLERGQRIDRDQMLRKLVEIQYERNDHDFTRGTFRVRGDIVEVYPSYEEQGLRIELFGDEVDALTSFDPLTGKTIRRHDKIAVYPKSHFVAPRDRTKRAVETIKEELGWYRSALESEGKLLEAQRLHQRTMFDLEMIREIGYCHGIENYARHLTGPGAGRAASDAARLPAERRPDHRRREPSDRAAGSRDVSWRSVSQGSARRVRIPAAVRARQPAAQFRGVGETRGTGGLRVGDAGPLRAGPIAGRGRRTDYPADRPDRSADRRPPGQGPGGRSAAGDPEPGRAQRARAGHDADQTDGGGPDAVLPGAGRPGPIPAFRYRDARARRDSPGSPPRRVRRAGRHQPAAGRAGPAGSLVGRHPRRGQGGVSAVGRLADSDIRPGRPKRQRPRHHVRRHGHALDGSGDRRNRAAAGRCRRRTTRNTASRRNRS